MQANLCKTERDKATRALMREVGEEVPLAKVLEGGTDWRGRSQQISLLKNKIAELQQAQVHFAKPCAVSAVILLYGTILPSASLRSGMIFSAETYLEMTSGYLPFVVCLCGQPH